MTRKWFWIGIMLLAAMGVMATVGGSFYMLDYALEPEADRTDTAACFRRQYETYPEVRQWVDSLRQREALRDTFVTMPTGERHHALYVSKGSRRTALVLHGWRDCGIDFLYLARMYEQLLDYNVVVPDLHAHGLSEGERIQMGWKDRRDALHWLQVFRTDTMVVHGVSMGGATAMMLSAEKMPAGICDIRFVDDCGYTSVWDEFEGELRNQFGMPSFPLLYSTSMLCKVRYGWSFGEASALEAVRRTAHRMLFIHGSADAFVPTAMGLRLYKAKDRGKSLWIAPGAAHAKSYLKHRQEYVSRVRDFVR